MSEFTVRSDSGKMSGSNELQEWAKEFQMQYGTYPLELWGSDEQAWMAGALGYDPARKYRLNEAARAILREEEAEDGSEFVHPTVDSGEMYGSNELKKWADKFYEQHRIEPLEVWDSDDQVWLAYAIGCRKDCKHRLTKAAKSLLHRVGIFDQINNLLDQEKQQMNAELEFHKRVNNCHLEELSVVRAALDESRADEKRLVSERDTARDAAARYYAKAEERQAELTHSLKSASELLSERDKLAINVNSKWWLLRRLLLLMIGVKR